MPGERTPSSEDRGHDNDDNISLREHVQRQIDTVRSNLMGQIIDLRTMLDERYQTQTKAVEAAFAAQQQAMTTALTAAERAVQTALLSAEKAVGKAEVAADKRFESVNEFRAQLADQANTFMPRSEADARITAVNDKMSTESARVDQRFSEIEKRLNLTQGQSAGIDKGREYLGWMIAIAAALVSLYFATKGS